MHRVRFLFLLLVLATLTTSLSAQGASQPRYLALGDSVTFGFINNAGFEYANAANFIGFPTYAGLGANMNVVNAACPGETTASLRPDGLWYNTLDWNGQTDPAPSVPDNGPPAPPSSPASPCPCSHDATYYAVVADVQSEYDWERVKILGKMVGFSWGIDGIEHQVPEQWGHWLPGLDLILWGRDTSELLELQRKAHEEIEKRLGCTD